MKAPGRMTGEVSSSITQASKVFSGLHNFVFMAYDLSLVT